VSALQELASRIASCPDCDLCKTRTRSVPGEGPDTASILLVGEGPGFHEDQQGRPFVGQAGKFLEELLASVGLKRSDVYITNVVKCRPPNNRDPLPVEVDACRKYLEEQIRTIKPLLIVTLGRYSLAWFFPRDTISKVHGHLRERDGIHYLHMYHPAAALHSGGLRQTILNDFSRVPEALEKARVASQPVEPPPPQPEQMRMFQ
jgi:DNA polymerase